MDLDSKGENALSCVWFRHGEGVSILETELNVWGKRTDGP